MKKAKRWWDASCFDRYFFGILIALELLMSFTFLGYIHIPPISLTIAYLPILVAGCLFGPVQSMAVGVVFGLASMYKASASYVLPADAVFSPFFSGNPAGSLILSVGTRALFGLLTGIAFEAVRKSRRFRLWMGVVSAAAPKVHSLLVYSAMGIFFPELGHSYRSAFHFDLDDGIFVMVCVVAVEVLWTIYHSDTIQNKRQCIDCSIDNPYASEKMNLYFGAFAFFMVCMAVFAAVYFSERESFMLERYGILVSDRLSADLLLLQIQFLIAMLSLNAISVILLFSIYRYMSYKEYMGEIDELTGIMGRKMFLYYCDKVQRSATTERQRTGWFLFVDVDHFKSINDTFGHPVGDKVLRGIAADLQNVFGEAGKAGRIGGDEFAVMIDRPISQQELEQRLEQFLKAISGILSERKVSCSIGAHQFAFPQEVKQILSQTDEMLYKAKEKGRACYVVQACIPDEPECEETRS